MGYFKTVDRIRVGNREPVPCSLLGYILPMFQKCISGIRKASFLLTIIGFILVSGFAFIKHVWHKMILKKCYLAAYNEYCEQI